MIEIVPLDFIFICFSVIIVFFGSLINFLEPYLPVFIVQSYLFGKYAYEGTGNKIITKLEVPKSWFRHFYIFSTIWSLLFLCFAIYVHWFDGVAPDWLMKFLDFWGGANRTSTTSSTTTLVVLGLLYLQCLRRMYETHCVQVFASTSRMNTSHYIVGYLHYFGVVLAIVTRAEGFTRSSTPRKDLGTLSLSILALMSALFLLAWVNQFKANITLANLRKDRKSKAVISQKHSVPSGGWFEVVSSPHMFWEVIMYLSMGMMLYSNISMLYVILWVLINQIGNAVLTHRWYRKTFKNYPETRKAIFPYVL